MPIKATFGKICRFAHFRYLIFSLRELILSSRMKCGPACHSAPALYIRYSRIANCFRSRLVINLQRLSVAITACLPGNPSRTDRLQIRPRSRWRRSTLVHGEISDSGLPSSAIAISYLHVLNPFFPINWRCLQVVGNLYRSFNINPTSHIDVVAGKS